MTLISKPNVWIELDSDATTRLTYALSTNPSPLTISLDTAPPTPPTLASLEFVITNPTAGAIKVSSITFTLEVGQGGTNITTSTSGIATQVSDPNNWQVIAPGNVTSGPAPYELVPAGASLGAGASVVLTIYEVPTVLSPGTTTIEIKEIIGSTPNFTSILVTMFPYGFYFNGLAAHVQKGSGLFPVAQVALNELIKLVWNSSANKPDPFTILYSSATQGQQTARPSKIDEWDLPPLTSDTVFTLVMAVTSTGGQTLTLSMSTTVSVLKPALVASSITANGITVNGAVSAQSATVSGAVSAGTLGFPNSLGDKISLWGDMAGDHYGLGIQGGLLQIYTIDDVSDIAFGYGRSDGLTETMRIKGNGQLNVASGCSIGLPTTAPRVPGVALQVNGGFAKFRYNTQSYPATDDGGGLVIGYNRSGGWGETNFYNPRSAAAVAFQFTQLTSDSDGKNIRAKDIMTMSSNGNVHVGGDIEVSGTITPKESLHILGPNGNYNNDMWIGLIEWEKNYWLHLGGCWQNTDNVRRVWVGGTTHVEGDITVNGQIWGKIGSDYKQLVQGYDEWTWWRGGTAPSDLRLKGKVQTVSSALDKVRRLTGVTFRWNEDGLQYFTRDIETTVSAGPNATEPENQKVWQIERDKRRDQLAGAQLGVIAQEVEAVLPEAVTTDEAGYKSVRYDNLIPVLIEAVKELAQTVKDQSERTARQEQEIARLTANHQAFERQLAELAAVNAQFAALEAAVQRTAAT